MSNTQYFPKSRKRTAPSSAAEGGSGPAPSKKFAGSNNKANGNGNGNSKSANFAGGNKSKPSGFAGKPQYNKPKGPGNAAPSGAAAGAGAVKSKSRPTREREPEIMKRKRPITRGGGEEEVNDDEDEDVSMDEEESPSDDDEDEVMGEDSDGKATGDGEGEGAAPAEKKKLSKVEKAALHAQQPHRTTLLPSHPLIHDTLLPLWETARRADLSKEDRKKAINELWLAVKGRVAEVSRGHKGGRVLQTIVKYGGKEERTGVAMELEPQWKAMMESKYSKFLMSKLIRYCPSIRPLLIAQLAPHLLNLLNHAHAVAPLSDLYDLYASAKERRLLVRGFYPREVKIFDGAKQGAETKGLEGSLEDMGEDGKGRERVLDIVEKTVLDVFNATQKQALAQAIFHRLVLEYVTCIYKYLDAETADKKMHELLAAGAESFPEIVHTKDGSAVVRELIVRCNAKDRKQILQPLRKHVEALCKDGDAQLVLFTAFDCVDDTKLMGKAFVSDIVGLASTLAFDKHGRRVLLYLLTPTSTKHFIPSIISSLAASAQQAKELGTSKKDVEVRRKEILSQASEGLLKVIEEKGEEMVRDPGAGMVVQEVLLYAQGDKSAAIEALANALQAPYPDPAPVDPNPDQATSHPFDLSHAIRTYKTLLSGGHYNQTTQTLSVPDETLSPAFAKAVWEAIKSDEAGGDANVVRIAKGNAPFVVVELIEALKKSGKVGEVKNVLGGKGTKEEIAKSVRKGSAMLAEKIAEL